VKNQSSSSHQVRCEHDYNSDGKVDAADYIVWRKSDINGQQGYLDWRNNFGRTSGSGSGNGVSIVDAVPEPTCGVLVVAGSFIVLLGIRRPNLVSRARSVAASSCIAV
jgi:hypothetical protein